MSMLSVPCPLCSEKSTAVIGPVIHPQPAHVAGVAIDLGRDPFELRRCDACGFHFKWPEIDQDRLLACYEQADAGHWENSPDPRKRRWDELRTLIARHKPLGRLLDVGCFNGALQQYLGNAWAHFGVEPSREAAAVAASRGVEIIGETIEDVADDAGLFDVIIAIDVVEHLPRPMQFFQRVAQLLAPGGVAVFGTGDTDAQSWQLLGSRYWYCSLPEHVSFYNQRSMQHIARACGLRSIAHVQTSHIRARPDKRLRQALRNRQFALRLRLPGLREAARKQPPPGWLAATDHMWHVMGRD